MTEPATSIASGVLIGLSGLMAVVTENVWSELGVIGMLGFFVFFMMRHRFTTDAQNDERLIKAIEELSQQVRKVRGDQGKVQLMMLTTISKSLDVTESAHKDTPEVVAAVTECRTTLLMVRDTIKEGSGYTQTRGG